MGLQTRDYERFRQQVSDTDWDTIINDDDTTNNVCNME